MGAVYQFPLWCYGGKRRRGVPRNQAKVSISVQQDHQDGRTEVIVEPTAASPPEPFAGEDCFLSGWLVLIVSLSIWPLWDPFPPTFGKRTRASINRTSHHHRGASDLGSEPFHLNHLTSSSSSRTPHLLRLFIHCTSSSSAPRGNPPQNWSRVLHRKVARTRINLCVSCSLGSSS